MPEARRSEGEWVETTLGELTAEQNVRVGSPGPAPVVLSSTKHYGLVPSDEYFKNRTIYSDDLTNYKRVLKDWFAYATNHLAEGSIGRQKRFDDSCVSPIYTVFSCTDGVHPPYLERVVKSVPVVEQYKTHEQATVDRRGAVRYRDFARVRVHLPPPIQQVKIAEVLDILDTTIRQTEAIIEKLKHVKQGLLHDLLTRGIDANGELRPPQSQASHLYKDSPLGLIPREWDASTVAAEFNACSGITLGPHRAPRLNPRKYLRVANVQRARIDLTDVAELEATDAEMANRGLAPGDLLVVEGHASPDEIGRCAMADESVRGFTFQNHLFRLRATRLNTMFVLQWMNSSTVRAYWRKQAATSSGLNTINRTKLSGVLVAVPPIAEQGRIVSIVEAAERRLRCEASQLSKLKVQKSGLMDDLLTGRVRVTPLLDTAARA